MKRFKFFKKIWAGIKRMRLVDLFLLIFMIILIGQSVYNLLNHKTDMQGGDAIDIVIRTTIAAIFGYFISANFLNAPKPLEETTKNKEVTITDIELGNSSCESRVATKKVGCRVRQQIIIVACLGLTSLALLIITRNVKDVPVSAIAAVSQLRDILSASVGLLIGHSTQETGK